MNEWDVVDDCDWTSMMAFDTDDRAEDEDKMCCGATIITICASCVGSGIYHLL